ncbi:MAG: hypothetical protein SGILL_002987 [Bacillariaceae sp.]
MTGTTAEEAAAKAKEIASRLMANASGVGEGTPSLPITTTTTSAAATAAATATAASTAPIATTERKRKRWGNATEALPGLAEAARKKQQQQTSTQETSGSTKRLWVPISAEKKETHFVSYLKDRLPELCTKINVDLFKGDEKNRFELGGRGASDKIVPGMPLEPLHVLIHGSEEFIEKATPQVDELLTEAEKAEREGPPPEASDASRLLESSGNHDASTDYSTALTLTRPYRGDTIAANAASQSGYRPATVAQLISTNPNALNPTMGASPDELLEEVVHVPNGVVGFLIGRGGETISSLQARSGCKVQIQKEHELQPGQTHRVITLQATSKRSIDSCREEIESMVQDRIRAAGGNINGAGGRDDARGGGPSNSVDAKVSEALAAGHALVTMDVPDADVGLIIGKAGTTIKSIQDLTQSAIQIPPAGNADNPTIRTISITSPTKEGAEAAKARIASLLQSKPSYASQGGSSHTNTSGPQITIEVSIPDRDVGLCIGRQGCVIREMQQKTGTRIQIPSHPTLGQPHRIATVSGTQEGCEQARILIERIVTEQTSACVMSRGHHNGGYQNQQNTAQSNDPAWQAYYAAQALAQQQQQQQQQTSVNTGQQASDAYYEQFFRYAYYYGEDAARQYYGSWSPPAGVPNPYGVNPNPSPAPAADASQAPEGPQVVASAPAPASQQTITAARDTSVRKVSNLPAWMTRH